MPQETDDRRVQLIVRAADYCKEQITPGIDPKDKEAAELVVDVVSQVMIDLTGIAYSAQRQAKAQERMAAAIEDQTSVIRSIHGLNKSNQTQDELRQEREQQQALEDRDANV